MEKARKDEIARKEKEVAEQAKVLAAQQAARERAKAEKAAAEKAAAEKAAKARLEARPLAPSPIKKGPPPTVTPPISAPSPTLRSVRPLNQKPPQYYPPPQAMPPIAAYQNRMPIPQTFAPGFRPGYPTQSPVFSPPSNPGPSISPNPPPRVFAEPSPPFAHGMRTAPIGMGFPPKSSTSRLPLVDETFAPSTAPIGLSNRVGSVGELNGMMAESEFRRLPLDQNTSSGQGSGPGPGPIGSTSLLGLGAIGRPQQQQQTYLEPTPPLMSLRSNSPAPPDQVFGSAALGGDDEIVQPTRRTTSNGWEIPAVAAPGAGRWSSASSIWGGTSTSSAEVSVTTPSWGAPGSIGGSSSANERNLSISSVGVLPINPNQSQSSRQPSFVGLPIGQHQIPSHLALQHQQQQQQQHHGLNGYQTPTPNIHPGGNNGGYPQNLFSPPPSVQHGQPSLH